MAHPQQWFAPRARAVLFVIAIVAACAFPARGGATEGAWAQLGVPFRVATPLLWDSLGQRLVAIGGDAFEAADSIEDAWEFRNESGWRRIRLPQPPDVELIGFSAPIADPARRRFLQYYFTDFSIDSMCVWSLELGPPPQWKRLAGLGAVPYGSPVESLGDEALWVESHNWSSGAIDLWTRSLADTGTWRYVRGASWLGGGFVEDFVDDRHQRRIALRNSADTIEVLTLPFVGAGDWTPEPTATPSPVGFIKSIVVRDPHRQRMLLLGRRRLEPEVREAWAFVPDSVPRWEYLGELPYAPTAVARGLAGDTLVLHGLSGAQGGQTARTIAVSLEHLAEYRVLSDPVWPPASLGAAILHDASRSRWLMLGGDPIGPGWSSALDSLWELRLDGTAAYWRKLPVVGTGPAVMEYFYRWAPDPENGVIYVLNGWPDERTNQSPSRELWALRCDGVPRWELVSSGGVWPRLSGAPVLVLDSIHRRLVCFGFRPLESMDFANEVWTFSLDSLAGWERHVPEGSPPAVFSGTTAAFDAARERIVMVAANGAIATLDMRAGFRWGQTACLAPTSGTCLAPLRRMEGIFDPIAGRLLEFGGEHDPFFNIGARDFLYAIPAADSLGPVHRMDVVGSAGIHFAPTVGRDESRDALIVFGGDSQRGLFEFRFDRTAVLVAHAVSFAAHIDHVALRWSSTPGASFRLWRREGDGAWAPLADLLASSTGDVAFDDRAIEAGVRYGYRLTATLAPYAPAAADVWLTAATTASFALARPWPNPARGTLNLAYTLASAAPVELEVFDIAGRRVWSRRFEALAPGPHHVAIAAGELPRSGLYFVRLRQAGLIATRRVVLAP